MKHSISHIVKTTLILFLFTLTFTHPVNAQVSKKAQKYFDLANYDIGLNKYDTAKENLLLAIKMDADFMKAHLYLANVYYQLNEYNNAIEEYNYALEQKEFPFVVHLYLARSHFSLQQYDAAIQHINSFLANEKIFNKSRTEGERLKMNAEFSRQAIKHSLDFYPKNLGESVNSDNDEYMPCLSADEETVIYTRKINNQEDLYLTGKKGSDWLLSNPLEEGVITTGHNEGAHCISADGKLLLYTICNERATMGSCDLYFSKKTKQGWSLPVNIGSPINSTAWDAQPSLSADGKSIYFVSSRGGGFGGKDIWVCHYINKKWSSPINLGSNVNTAFDEQSPFIHFDNETLYFSSDGHPGLGKQDIYFSRLKDAGFGKAVNLGWPINTGKNESGLSISLDGNTAYYAAEHDNGFGGLDIYEFQTPNFAKPKRVTYVKAIILDQISKEAINAEFVLSDIEGNLTSIKKITEDGSFLICLPSGKDYSLHVKKDGYLFESYHFQLKDTVERKARVITVNLKPLTSGKSVVLNNVFFPTNSFELMPTSKIELDELVDLLLKHKEARLEISGHTDNTGSAEYNIELSQKRAQSVVDYLIEHDIAMDRLIAKGYGDQKPIANNSTEAGKAKNRRTEFLVID